MREYRVDTRWGVVSVRGAGEQYTAYTRYGLAVADLHKIGKRWAVNGSEGRSFPTIKEAVQAACCTWDEWDEWEEWEEWEE